MIFPNMDGALTFTQICVDSSRIVLEHHRPFTPPLLIVAELYTRAPQTLHPIYISKPAGRGTGQLPYTQCHIHVTVHVCTCIYASFILMLCFTTCDYDCVYWSLSTEDHVCIYSCHISHTGYVLTVHACILC